MKHIRYTITQLIMSLIIIFVTFSPGNSAEIDDSSVFVEAFNAYQQKDYLLTIEKCDQLNQVFPDSPLRDVTLLLIARASLKSGDNERAAKSITLFAKEFPESSLKTSVEDELKLLASRYQKGDVLTEDKTLQMAARKVRSDTVAREQAAALKLEMERIAKAKVEEERLARIKLEEERHEKERLLAEKLAKENIKAAIFLTLHESNGAVPVGGTGALPIEIANKGKSSEDFLLTITAPKEYTAALVKAAKPDENMTHLTLAAGETFKGSVVFKMPAEMVDGHRSALVIKAVSAKFEDISFQKEVVVVSSAPLVRAVAKLTKQKVVPGERLHYRVTVLNAGSIAARNLAVRLKLPPQVDFIGAPDGSFKQEQDGTLVFQVDHIDIGKLAEINMDVKIRENSVAGQELRGHVEIADNSLQRKDIFTATASIVQPN